MVTRLLSCGGRGSYPVVIYPSENIAGRISPLPPAAPPEEEEREREKRERHGGGRVRDIPYDIRWVAILLFRSVASHLLPRRAPVGLDGELINAAYVVVVVV